MSKDIGWRLLVYKVTTQLIIWLSALREKTVEMQTMRRRIDRTFYPSNHEYWACCDCGLVHLTMPLNGEEFKEKAFKFIPIRPDGYDYSMRIGCEKPSPSIDESTPGLVSQE